MTRRVAFALGVMVGSLAYPLGLLAVGPLFGAANERDMRHAFGA